MNILVQHLSSSVVSCCMVSQSLSVKNASDEMHGASLRHT